MGTQQASKSSGWQKLRRLPGWLRYVFMGLVLVSLGLLGFFWIIGVNNDTLNKDMAALFVVLTAMFAFLAMPFLYRSEQTQQSDHPIPAVSSSSPPAQFIINNNNFAQQPSNEYASSANTSVSPSLVPFAQSDEPTKGEISSSPRPGTPPAFAIASASSLPSGGFPEHTAKASSMKLTGQEVNDLTDALLDAYPEKEDFEVMLKVKLNKKLNTLVDSSNNYWNLVFKLIGLTEAEGWTNDLVIAAHERRPLNLALQSWLQRYEDVKVPQESPQNTPISNKGAEALLNDQATSAEREQKSHAFLAPDSLMTQEPGQTSSNDQSIKQALISLKEAYNAVQQSEGIFEDRGDIQQIHYSLATAALRSVASCAQNLQNLLQTVSPLPAYLDRERLIIDLRRISSETRDSIEHIANYDTLNTHQRERSRKDTAMRLSSVITCLNDLNRRMMSKGPS